MGRTADQALPYWQHGVKMHDDPKMVDLNDKYGPLGELVFERILCNITQSNGYFALLNEQLIKYVYRSIGSKWIKLAVIPKIIQYCGACGLFDINLLSQNVITSRGIQRRWLDVKKKNRARGYSTAEFWLLERDEQDMPISCNNDNSCSNNTDKCNNNMDKYNNNSCKEKISKSKDTVVAKGNTEQRPGFYGIHNNIYLSESSFAQLGKMLTDKIRDDYINRLSGFIKSKAKDFRGDPAATILKWHQKDLSEGKIAAPVKKTYTSDQINAIMDKLTYDDI